MSTFQNELPLRLDEEGDDDDEVGSSIYDLPLDCLIFRVFYIAM